LLTFFQLDILRNYDLILSSLNFRTLYSGRRHLDALFFINIFKGKINCHSIMDTVGIRVPTRQIRECSTFSVNSVQRHIPSARCVIAANDICRFLDIFGKNDVSFEDIFSIRESVQICYMYLVLFCFHFFVAVFCYLYLFYILVLTL
jgi:hypothetical protein